MIIQEVPIVQVQVQTKVTKPSLLCLYTFHSFRCTEKTERGLSVELKSVHIVKP